MGRADQVLQGAKFALTGRFASMTQREAAALVEQFGGDIVGAPGRSTNFLIVGGAAPPLESDGQPSGPLKKVRQLQACGYHVQILTEDGFLAKIGLIDTDADVHQRYTVAQLSRILSVTPETVRKWVRSGLIEPVETVHRLDFFAYPQVTTAKMLCDLLSSGLPFARLREGLHRLQRWLPGIDSSLGQLSVLEESGRLLIRLEDGHLAEPTGQLQLQFGPPDEVAALPIPSAARTTDDWFQDALAAEDEGAYHLAAMAYERAIEMEPEDPVLHFNLGNVLFASGDYPRAAAQFSTATELDAEYVEAWNNLGNVLADLHRYDESLSAFRRALAVFPLYADAHYGLGDLLHSLGRNDEARQHWLQYLELDPKSPWSADLRHRLASLAGSEV